MNNYALIAAGVGVVGVILGAATGINALGAVGFVVIIASAGYLFYNKVIKKK